MKAIFDKCLAPRLSLQQVSLLVSFIILVFGLSSFGLRLDNFYGLLL